MISAAPYVSRDRKRRSLNVTSAKVPRLALWHSTSVGPWHFGTLALNWARHPARQKSTSASRCVCVLTQLNVIHFDALAEADRTTKVKAASVKRILPGSARFLQNCLRPPGSASGAGGRC